MRRVQRPGRTDRQAHAVQRQRVALGDCRQHAVRRPAIAHVVLGMHLEEADIRRLGQDGVAVLRLEAQPGAWGQGVGTGLIGHRSSPGGSAERGGRGRPPRVVAKDQPSIGSSMPLWPSTSMVVQVPAGTAFQALPWKSLVEVLAQVVPAPAAQSFWPASEMP